MRVSPFFVLILFTNLEDFAGKLSVKHIYEIAKVKSKDKMWVGYPLKVSNLYLYLNIPFIGSLPKACIIRSQYGH
jgi:hypothetical protein